MLLLVRLFILHLLCLYYCITKDIYTLDNDYNYSLLLSNITPYVMLCKIKYPLFVFSELRWEVVVRFVDIGGITKHHYLNFLFAILQISFILI